jgi:hypothetical protein
LPRIVCRVIAVARIAASPTPEGPWAIAAAIATLSPARRRVAAAIEAGRGRVGSASIGPLTGSTSRLSQWPSATAMRSVLGSLPGWPSQS